MSHGKSVQIIIHQDLELVKRMANNAIPFLHLNTTNNAINKKTRTYFLLPIYKMQIRCQWKEH